MATVTEKDYFVAQIGICCLRRRLCPTPKQTPNNTQSSRERVSHIDSAKDPSKEGRSSKSSYHSSLSAAILSVTSGVDSEALVRN
jgi:hypothetical protein